MTQKWEENIPKFYFCIRAPTFSRHMPCPLKICFTNKVNKICGGGQLLVTGSQGPTTRVPGVRIPYPRVTSPKAQGPRALSLRVWRPGSRVPNPRVSGLRVPGPGFQVLILDYGIFFWCYFRNTSFCYFIFLFLIYSLNKRFCFGVVQFSF